MLKYIQSTQNPQVKQWKKLLTKKERDKTKLFLVEGFHLVEEALKEKHIVKELIVSEEIEIPRTWNYENIEVTTITAEIARGLTDTEAPQGIFAICFQQVPDDVSLTNGSFLLLDSIQDPGNLGTIIRTADAAGISAVIVGNGCVDLYNPKVLRSAQGSHFHLPILRGDLEDYVEKLTANEVPVFGTALESAIDYTNQKPSDTFALIVGNEGSGVDRQLLEMTKKNLYIPIFGKSESLNVAVATGILLYHFKRS